MNRVFIARCFVAISLCGLAFLPACTTPPQASSFTAWAEQQPASANQGLKPQQLVLRSKAMQIDTIYRSMQGPFDLHDFRPPTSDLIYLTGYRASLRASESNEELPNGYMCHNNLNLANRNGLPWAVKTYGTKIRLFTLTEGQTAVELPEGFGIPFAGKEQLELVSQVLNHNEPEASVDLVHEVTIDYVEAAPETLKPLYQQAVFVTKRTGGPVGHYDQPTDSSYGIQTDTAHLDAIGNCQPQYSGERYDPFLDNFGRSFSGHWPLIEGREVLHTEVTPMLNLPFDTRIHYIGVHVHPYAESLELRDLTLDSSLFVAHVQNHADRIGIREIEAYSSATGIPVFKDHRYELVSTYNCLEPEGHSAMATMFLYLHDRE